MATRGYEVDVEYVGGPFDSTFVTVPVDPATGQPPQFPTTQALGPADFRINPTTGPIADVVAQLYELDTVLDGTGVRWIYRFTGETRIRPTAA